jgi:hypothetical protein
MVIFHSYVSLPEGKPMFETIRKFLETDMLQGYSKMGHLRSPGSIGLRESTVINMGMVQNPSTLVNPKNSYLMILNGCLSPKYGIL